MSRTQYIDIRTGTEGPHYDPYGFTELTFQRLDGTRIVVHRGLVAWLRVDNGEKLQFCDDTGAELEAAFQAPAGLSLAAAMSVPSRLADKAWRKMSRSQRDACDEADRIDADMLRNAE